MDTEEVTTRETRDGRGAPLIPLGVGLDMMTVARLDRLRACLGVGRSRVAERSLASALDDMEARYASEVERFNRLATRAGQNWDDYARWYAREYAKKTYPPTVVDLEREEGH